MAWEHFDVKKSGICKVLKKETGEIFEYEYKRGIVSTGKSRVFWGYQILIKNGQMEIVGKSKGDSEPYSLALKDCNRKMESEGLVLLVAGNSDNYSESPMSGGAGYGYIKGIKEAIDIMSFLSE
ncbi:MAG: hypothetical protein U1F70_13960 [Candidatus Competibacteraceae bacterium]